MADGEVAKKVIVAIVPQDAVLHLRAGVKEVTQYGITGAVAAEGAVDEQAATAVIVKNYPIACPAIGILGEQAVGEYGRAVGRIHDGSTVAGAEIVDKCTIVDGRAGLLVDYGSALLGWDRKAIGVAAAQGEAVEDCRSIEVAVTDNMNAVVAIIARRADVAAENSLMRRPVPVRKSGGAGIGEAAVDGYAVLH